MIAVFDKFYCLFGICFLNYPGVVIIDINLIRNINYIISLDKEFVFFELKRSDTHFGKSLVKIWRFFVVAAYSLARSKYVFLDNMFLPMAFLKFRKSVSVVQLWHGTGVIKKIGADANHGRLKELEFLANQNNTHLLVSSNTTKRIYGKSFSMPEDKVFVTGLPRTDVFFNSQYQYQRVRELLKKYPILKGKKLVLYAPTFRDSQVDEPKLGLNINSLAKQLGEEYVVGLRLHPFVAKHYNDKELPDNVINFSGFRSLNTLLFATALLITDYSSITFEYAVLKRPIIFFAYDLNEFEKNSRGFYWNYKEYVPGPVVENEEELIESVRKVKAMTEEEYEERYGIKDFVNDTFAYNDGKSCQRIARLLGIEK